MRKIAIFRQNLFRISEPFITQQAGGLQRYTPVYVGRARFGAAPAGSESVALQDPGSLQSLSRMALQMLTRQPGPYLRLLHSHKPALMHAHFGTDAVYALPVARRLNIPLLTTFHGFDATLSTTALLTSPAWANFVFFRGQLARQGDVFLCVSSFIRDKVLAMGFPEARTHLHYTGIDWQAIQPRAPDEALPVILHVGRLVEMKGAQYLIRAFAALPPRHAPARLVIIGEGALRNQLQSLARSLGVQERVQFLGALPHTQVMQWIRRAQMLVLPSVLTATGRVEGLGMVLLEASATGVPAIGSSVGGIPEGILDGRTGFLVPPRDPQALGARIVELLDQPELRLRMGAEARSFVAEQFDLRRQNDRLQALYDRLVDAGPFAEHAQIQ